MAKIELTEEELATILCALPWETIRCRELLESSKSNDEKVFWKIHLNCLEAISEKIINSERNEQ